MGNKRFALSAEQVTELARHKAHHEDEPQSFPHTTPLLIGVVVRRNQIVPVADLAPVLIGPNGPERKFYLVVNRAVNGKTIRMAIPVTGECELADAEPLPVTGTLPPYVSGLLSFDGEIVEVLDIEQLMSAEVRT
jgi:chemotaxis signal transduction protein